MRTFQAKSLLGASLDQIQMDQLRIEQGKENALRMDQIARNIHAPVSHVHCHVQQMAAAPQHRAAVGALGGHSDQAVARKSAATQADALDELRREAEAADAAQTATEAIRAQERSAEDLFGAITEPQDPPGAMPPATPAASSAAPEPSPFRALGGATGGAFTLTG